MQFKRNGIAEQRIFFSLGDREVQLKYREKISVPELINDLELQLKTITFLSDAVIHSPSFPFESEATKVVFTQNKDLFLNDKNFAAVSQNIDSFVAHLDKKLSVTPSEQHWYRDKSAQNLAKNMDNFIPLIHRTGISDKIIALWESDLSPSNNQYYSLFKQTFIRFPDKQDRKKILEILRSIPHGRGKTELVKEYLEIKLHEYGLPNDFINTVCDRLLDFWIVASAESTSSVPMQLSRKIQIPRGRLPSHFEVKRYNISMFLKFLEHLGALDAFIKLRPVDIIKIQTKYPELYYRFRDKYFELIDVLGSEETKLMNLCKQIVREKHNDFWRKYSKAFTAASEVVIGITLATVFSDFSIQTFTFADLSKVSIPIISQFAIDEFLSRLLTLDSMPFLHMKNEIINLYQKQMKNELNLSSHVEQKP